MPLQIIIVGAGIAGLCAGVALRQAGHKVQIFEKSKFAAELGAALVVTPNGARVLFQLGFSFSVARAVKMDAWTVVRGDNFEPIAHVDFRAADQRFGAPIRSIHRVDLHNELLRLATSETEPGHPVTLHLASEVVDASTDGWIRLRNGAKHTADLVVGADGLHSVLKSVVAPTSDAEPQATGLSAFRFLIDTDKVNPATLKRRGPEIALLADVEETAKERHITWYACRGGAVQNFVGIHPSKDIDGDDPEAVKTAMLDEFGHFSPEVQELIRRSSEAKCWPLYIHKPLSDWSNGRIVIIGDAAHPMLPFGGQGANSAMEDGGALGTLLKNMEDGDFDSITRRLQMFGRVRQARAARIQILSSVRAGREMDVEEELRQYSDPQGSRIPKSMMERTVHDYSYNVAEKCEEILSAPGNHS
ncbi:putative salicylate hydroxylase [Polyplosphaeria fusca]|uniref:Salicylate hydroxylase n=1 Tax=Polyplosphaeria fusca TaxID=682080 RepID=A0A9P4UZA9_9PLEO|nr:putative salicylate hydroxylase [Polyplosphaeria fusca]